MRLLLDTAVWSSDIVVKPPFIPYGKKIAPSRKVTASPSNSTLFPSSEQVNFPPRADNCRASSRPGTPAGSSRSAQ